MTKQYLLSSYSISILKKNNHLLYGVWHVGIYEPKEQVSERPALSPQNHCTSAPSMGQGQVDGQQLHAQQKKLMVVSEERRQTALDV